MKNSALLCAILMAVGCTGAAGEDGAPGANGMDGMNGMDGQDGADGQDGQDGTGGAGFTRIVVVSPGATAAASGANLLAAIQQFVTTPATATNPWVIKIEPGVYDVGDETVTMPPFVDIEGSGQSSTTLIGSGTVLETAGTAEVRDLTVSCDGGSCSTIVNDGSPLITRVTARVEAATELSVAILSLGGNPSLLDVTVVSLGVDAQGIEISEGSPFLRGVDVIADGGGAIGPGGINIFDGSAFITDSTVSVETSGTLATGVYLQRSVDANAATLDDVYVTVAGTGGIALFVDSAVTTAAQGIFVRDSLLAGELAVSMTDSDVFAATANTQLGGDLDIGLSASLFCTSDYTNTFETLSDGVYGFGGCLLP